ncbi:MAG: SprT family zinc-dependent metalloprotease [Candidatus Kerfeldbacteria bacterium]
MQYRVCKSKRAKRLRISVHRDGCVVVTVPRRVSGRAVMKFVQQKEDWIRKAQQRQVQKKSIPLGVSDSAYPDYREQALELVMERVEHFNAHYGFDFNTVRVRNQRTRWGSCSCKGNLNFNFKLLFLPPVVRDYVIVHELCHLEQMNHSSAFWELVAQRIPDHTEQRRNLRAYVL